MKKVLKKMENSNSDADFEPFEIIKCFDFGQMKKKIKQLFSVAYGQFVSIPYYVVL